MHLINNHINGKTKCERLQIEHGRIPQRTRILVSATTTNIFVSFKSMKYYYLECSHVTLHSRNELIFIIHIIYTDIIAINMRLIKK